MLGRSDPVLCAVGAVHLEGTAGTPTCQSHATSVFCRCESTFRALGVLIWREPPAPILPTTWHARVLAMRIYFLRS